MPNNNCAKTLVYITTYALTEGIRVISVPSNTIPDCLDCPLQVNNQWHYRGDWHITPLCAISRAEKMRAAKLKSLQKSLVEIEDLVFDLD